MGTPIPPPPPRGTDFAPGGNRRSFSPWPVGGNMVPPAPTSVLGGGAGAAPPPWMDGHGQTGAAGPALLFLKDLGPTCGVSALSVFRGPSVCVPQPHGGGCVCGGLCVPPCILPQHCCCLGASPGRLGPLPLRLPRGPPCGAPPPPPPQARWFRLRLLSAPLAWFHLRASADSALSPSGHASCRRGGRSRGITVYLATPPAT